MLGHGAGIGYTGTGPRMGPTENFSLVTGPAPVLARLWRFDAISSDLE